MKLTTLRPMLWTEDLRATVDFFVDVLGFDCDEISEERGWASLSKDDVALTLARPNEHTPYEKIGFAGPFYFNTTDVDTLREDLRDKARICYSIEDFHYGLREFAICDNNGCLLQFRQPLQE